MNHRSDRGIIIESADNSADIRKQSYFKQGSNFPQMKRNISNKQIAANATISKPQFIKNKSPEKKKYFRLSSSNGNKNGDILQNIINNKNRELANETVGKEINISLKKKLKKNNFITASQSKLSNVTVVHNPNVFKRKKTDNIYRTNVQNSPKKSLTPIQDPNEIVNYTVSPINHAIRKEQVNHNEIFNVNNLRAKLENKQKQISLKEIDDKLSNDSVSSKNLNEGFNINQSIYMKK